MTKSLRVIAISTSLLLVLSVRAVAQENPAPAQPDAPLAVLTTDAHGHVIQKTIGESGADQQIWRYEYDEHDHRIKEVDPNGDIRCFEYNPQGWVTSVRRESAGHAMSTTVITYDDHGLVEGVTVDGKATDFPHERPTWRNQDLFIGDDPVY